MTAKKTQKKRVKAGTSKAYVYGLVDPRTNTMFYIGKGNGSRMYNHTCAAKRGKPGRKNEVIRNILSSKLEVFPVVLEEFETDEEAYAAEKRWIADLKEGLTNCNGGGGGSYSLGAYGYFRARAKKILASLAPIEVWTSRINNSVRAAMTNQFGSPEAFYIRLRDELIKESIDPAPNVVYAGPDGMAVFGWEY